MSGSARTRTGRKTARLLMAVVFALGVIVGPTGALAVTPATMYSPLTPQRVSVSSDGTQANDWSDQGVISDDGRFVAFESDATNLAGEDVNGQTIDVFYHDRLTRETTMVSQISEDADVWDRGARSPGISDDGRYVSFVTGKSMVATDTNGDPGLDYPGTGIDTYVRDMQTGVFTFCDIAGDGSATGDSNTEAFISGNGQYVVVGTQVDIASEDTNGSRDVYRYEISSGETTLVSPIDTLGYSYYGAKPIGMSDDGRYVAFITGRTIDAADSNSGNQDYYLKDMQTGDISFVAMNGGTTGADELWPEDGDVSLSGNGQYLVFETEESLVAADTDSPGNTGSRDVYVYDFEGSSFNLITGDFEEMMSGGRGSRSGSISDDGSRVLFFSGSDFVEEDINDDQDLYWYDVEADAYHLMSLPMVEGAMMTKGIAPAGLPSVGSDVYNIFVSGDGSTAVFQSGVRFTESDSNYEDDVFVRELEIDLLDGDFRLAGDDRYDTSVKISEEAFPNGADTVIIATGANWPDALCGSALAGAVDGPILLAAPGGLTASVKAEIDRLGATDAYVLGSSVVVSTAIEGELDDMLPGYVVRIAGKDRYWTSKAITNKVIELRPEMYDGTALVTTGGNYADAMAAAPLSAALAWPILLTNPADDSLYAPADLTHAIILGGTTAVPQVVEDDLIDFVGAADVERLDGDNRYETAAMIAQYGVDSGMHWDGVGVASGVNFPDALAGGASLGRLGAVALLTPPTTLAPAAAGKLDDNAGAIDTVYILGGPAAVSASVKAEILAILGL